MSFASVVLNSFRLVRRCARTTFRHSFSGHVVSNGGPSGVILASGDLGGEEKVSLVKRRCQRGNQGNPDEVQAAARSRDERLESALAVLGDWDSVEGRGLQAAAQKRFVAAQVEECQGFIPRSKQRLERLQEARVQEQRLLDAVCARMVKFREEMARTAGPVAPIVSYSTHPGKIPDLVAEVERLRARVAEMETEREEARKKRSRSLSVPSPDLVGGPDLSLQDWGRLHDENVGRGKGAIMETLINRGSTLAVNSNRFSPLA